MSTWWYTSKERNLSWWIKHTKQYFVVRGEHYVIRLKFSGKRHMSGSVATLVNFSASCQKLFGSVATLVNFSASCQNSFGFNLTVVERVLCGSIKKIKMDVLMRFFELITIWIPSKTWVNRGLTFFNLVPMGTHFRRKKASFLTLWASLLSFLRHKLWTAVSLLVTEVCRRVKHMEELHKQEKWQGLQWWSVVHAAKLWHCQAHGCIFVLEFAKTLGGDHGPLAKSQLTHFSAESSLLFQWSALSLWGSVCVTLVKALDLMNCQWQNALAIGKEKPNTKKAK